MLGRDAINWTLKVTRESYPHSYVRLPPPCLSPLPGEPARALCSREKNQWRKKGKLTRLLIVETTDGVRCNCTLVYRRVYRNVITIKKTLLFLRSEYTPEEDLRIYSSKVTSILVTQFVERSMNFKIMSDILEMICTKGVYRIENQEEVKSSRKLLV